MKEVVEYYSNKGILFRSLKQIPVKELGSRKRVEIYLGVDTQSYYTMIISIEKKSRILRKEAEEIMLFHEKLEKQIASKILKKYILIKAPLCSKAKKSMEEKGWKVEEVG
jgi:hypothetical protein